MTMPTPEQIEAMADRIDPIASFISDDKKTNDLAEEAGNMLRAIAAEMRNSESIGEIVDEFRDVGGYTPKIRWNCQGDHPGIGTKLYTTQPSTPDADNVKQLRTFIMRHMQKDSGLTPCGFLLFWEEWYKGDTPDEALDAALREEKMS